MFSDYYYYDFLSYYWLMQGRSWVRVKEYATIVSPPPLHIHLSLSPHDTLCYPRVLTLFSKSKTLRFEKYQKISRIYREFQSFSNRSEALNTPLTFLCLIPRAWAISGRRLIKVVNSFEAAWVKSETNSLLHSGRVMRHYGGKMANLWNKNKNPNQLKTKEIAMKNICVKVLITYRIIWNTTKKTSRMAIYNHNNQMKLPKSMGRVADGWWKCMSYFSFPLDLSSFHPIPRP